MKILVIHGPNLHVLGDREPEIYGSMSLNQINSEIRKHAKSIGVSVVAFQSNHEGDIVDKIGSASKSCDAIVINPAAYTHTSIAIRDAIAGSGLPAVEVHLSNVSSREEFRRHSMVAPVCKGVIAGFGPSGYLMAIDALAKERAQDE